MAVSTDVDWHCRVSGSMTNGGGFKAGASGTDYSQQDSAQESYTTLAATTGGVTLTCSGGDTFDANIVGNVIYIASGTNFNADWYEVTVRNSSTSVDLDRDPTNGTNASGGSGNMGGGLTIDAINDSAHIGDADVVNRANGSVTYYVQNGSHTLTTGNTIAPAGGAQDKVINIIGTNGTPGEVPTGTGRPEIDFGSQAMYYSGNYFRWANLRFTGTSSSGWRMGTDQFAINCDFINTSTGIAARTNGDCNFASCYFSCSSSSTALLGNSLGNCYRCYFDGGDKGLDDGSALQCIFDDCTTGISLTTRSQALGCTFYSCTTGASVGSVQRCMIINNIFKDCTTGIDITGNGKAALLFEPNLFHGCTTDIDADAQVLASGPSGSDWINTAGDPSFTDAANDDFTLGSGSAALDFGAMLLVGEG